MNNQIVNRVETCQTVYRSQICTYSKNSSIHSSRRHTSGLSSTIVLEQHKYTKLSSTISSYATAGHNGTMCLLGKVKNKKYATAASRYASAFQPFHPQSLSHVPLSFPTNNAPIPNKGRESTLLSLADIRLSVDQFNYQNNENTTPTRINLEEIKSQNNDIPKPMDWQHIPEPMDWQDIPPM